MTERTSESRCHYCDQDYTNQGITRHLSACDEREEAIQQAEGEQNETIHYHLKVQAQRAPDYVLHLEVSGDTPLKELDAYLRGIWLECCGHMSMFTMEAWSGNEIQMERTVGEVFRSRKQLTYIYDYGTESRLTLKKMDTRTGPSTIEKPVGLMARNRPLRHDCMKCEEEAEYLCRECQIETRETGLLCPDHREEHTCKDYGTPDRIVNSPRFGLCGYTGPAEPPY